MLLYNANFKEYINSPFSKLFSSLEKDISIAVYSHLILKSKKICIPQYDRQKEEKMWKTDSKAINRYSNGP